MSTQIPESLGEVITIQPQLNELQPFTNSRISPIKFERHSVEEQAEQETSMNGKPKGNKSSFRVDLTSDAIAVLSKLNKKTEVPNTRIVARVLEWYASLDEFMQMAVIRKDESVKAELARCAMEKMAGERINSVEGIELKTAEDLARSGKVVIDKMKQMIDRNKGKK